MPAKNSAINKIFIIPYYFKKETRIDNQPNFLDDGENEYLRPTVDIDINTNPCANIIFAKFNKLVLTDSNTTLEEEYNLGNPEDLHMELFGETMDEALSRSGSKIAEEFLKIDATITPNILRLERGLSQTKLSELSGITQPKLSEYENGQGNPTNETFKSWGNALSVEVEEICKAFNQCKK